MNLVEYLIEENRILRSKLPKRIRFTWPERLRLSTIGRKLGRARLATIASAANPATIIGWVKRWQNAQVNKAVQRLPGRPAITEANRQAILDLYEAGFTTIRRIRGELLKCDVKLARMTIARVLKRNGLTPGPDRMSTWYDFLRRHAHLAMGIDFLTVPVGLFGKVVNYAVLIGIEHDTRKLHVLGMTPNPDGVFMAQVAREATATDGVLYGRQLAIIDNDRLFTHTFRQTLTDAGCEPKRIALLAPNMNAHAERVIQSIKHECLDRFIFLNERMLRRAVSAYVEHYNRERPHQALDQRTVTPWEHAGNIGRVVVDERLGGALKSARRLAA